MHNIFCVLFKRNALIMLLLYMFVISLNLFIMYQSYGGSIIEFDAGRSYWIENEMGRNWRIPSHER